MKKLVAADIGIVLQREEYRIYPQCDSDETGDSESIRAPGYLQFEPIDVSHAEMF